MPVAFAGELVGEREGTLPCEAFLSKESAKVPWYTVENGYGETQCDAIVL